MSAIAELAGRLGLLWLDKRPFSEEARARRKARRRARRARRRGEFTSELIETYPEEGQYMFPQGTMTKSGIVLAVLGPMLAFGLVMLGLGSESCTPEQVAEGCVVASEVADRIIAGAAVLWTAIAGAIAWRGRNRAAEQAAAAVAAAKGAKQ